MIKEILKAGTYGREFNSTGFPSVSKLLEIVQYKDTAFARIEVISASTWDDLHREVNCIRSNGDIWVYKMNGFSGACEALEECKKIADEEVAKGAYMYPPTWINDYMCL